MGCGASPAGSRLSANGPGHSRPVLDVHGGAWNNGDRTSDTVLDTWLAEHGVLRWPSTSVTRRRPSGLGLRHDLCDSLAEGPRPRVWWDGAVAPSAYRAAAAWSCLADCGRVTRATRRCRWKGPDVNSSLAYVIACWPVPTPYRYGVARRAGNEVMVRGRTTRTGHRGGDVEASPPLICWSAARRSSSAHAGDSALRGREPPARERRRLVDWYRKRGGHSMLLFETLPSPFTISAEFPDTLRVMEAIRGFYPTRRTRLERGYWPPTASSAASRSSFRGRSGADAEAALDARVGARDAHLGGPGSQALAHEFGGSRTNGKLKLPSRRRRLPDSGSPCWRPYTRRDEVDVQGVPARSAAAHGEGAGLRPEPA